MSKIDTTNRYLVAAKADGSVVIMFQPLRAMSKNDALLLAAWLVAIADPLGDDFKAVLEAVQST